MDVDAVMVCNGHYTEPRLPALPGQGSFPGLQMHSHNYRTRQPFSGKRVVVVGAAASGIDIGLEIAQVADQARHHACFASTPSCRAHVLMPAAGPRPALSSSADCMQGQRCWAVAEASLSSGICQHAALLKHDVSGSAGQGMHEQAEDHSLHPGPVPYVGSRLLIRHHLILSLPGRSGSAARAGQRKQMLPSPWQVRATCGGEGPRPSCAHLGMYTSRAASLQLVWMWCCTPRATATACPSSMPAPEWPALTTGTPGLMRKQYSEVLTPEARHASFHCHAGGCARSNFADTEVVCWSLSVDGRHLESHTAD